MHAFADLAGLGGDSARIRPVAFDKPGGVRRITVLEGRPLFRDMIVFALRHALPDEQVESVSALDDIHPDHHQVILLNLVGRPCDRDDIESVLLRLQDVFPGLPLVFLMEQVPHGVPDLISRRPLVGWTTSRQGMAALVTAIHAVTIGGEPAKTEKAAAEIPLVRELPPSHTASPPQIGPEVSARERGILALVQEGKPNKLIAYELGISESTVKVHLRNLMCKLHVHNRTQLALTGYRPTGLARGNGHSPQTVEQMAAAVPVSGPML